MRITFAAAETSACQPEALLRWRSSKVNSRSEVLTSEERQAHSWAAAVCVSQVGAKQREEGVSNSADPRNGSEASTAAMQRRRTRQHLQSVLLRFCMSSCLWRRDDRLAERLLSDSHSSVSACWSFLRSVIDTFKNDECKASL